MDSKHSKYAAVITRPCSLLGQCGPLLMLEHRHFAQTQHILMQVLDSCSGMRVGACLGCLRLVSLTAFKRRVELLLDGGLAEGLGRTFASIGHMIDVHSSAQRMRYYSGSIMIMLRFCWPSEPLQKDSTTPATTHQIHQLLSRQRNRSNLSDVHL